MAVPFPSSVFPANFTPYPLTPFQDPAGFFSAKSAWLPPNTPPANATVFDVNALRPHEGSAISVVPGPPPKLLITAQGNALTFDLSGDGTGRIPVGIIDP